MTFLVKTCGLKTVSSVETAIECNVDMIGFNFFRKSPRYVDLSLARELADLIRGKADIVIVVVDADRDYLLEIISGLDPDWLQLHGNETPRMCQELANYFHKPIMKAVGIKDMSDVARLDGYYGIVDRFLLDAKPSPKDERTGGLGVPFNWQLLDGVDASIPYMLSGGLTIHNVGDAISLSRCLGVDVASGIESAPGVKDNELIKSFIQEVKQL